MKEKVTSLVEEALKDLEITVSNVQVVDQEGVTALEIELDRQEMLDLDTITKATELINPLLDASGIIDESIDVVDIYGKSKGEVE